MLHAALERHPAAPCISLRGIQVFLKRAMDGQLDVQYVLEGEIERLRIPPRSKVAHSAERLWRHTCCEIFVAREGERGYDEYNFSPSGEWAAYAFTGYREGSALAVPDPGISVTRNASRLELEARIARSYPGKLSIGLSAVVEETDGALSYWALRHPPGKPDFHHPTTFALELDEVRH
jgi:hypothetical protein